MNEKQPQIIKFIQACPPALDDGEYRISVEQKVELSPGDVKTLNTVQEFSVKGARFEINPDDINSVFPPANQTGNYGNCLPHIIINKKTFAWERNIFAKKAIRVEADNEPIDVTPWVAVLSFSKEEAPEIKKNTVKAILSPEADIIAAANNIKLDEHIGESLSTPCFTIDIPVGLFNKIAPNINELKYLAHARYVKLDKKVTSSDKEGYYSVIIGNRLPLSSNEGETNISHLVSLEGLGEYIPGGSSPITDPKKKIRLISLVNWKYLVKIDKLAFANLIKSLNSEKGLSVPVSDSQSQTKVKEALNMGFTALKHNLRNGEKTVSWYRGPLVPLSTSNEEMKCFTNSDQLLRYNPNTGMFDVSYSAAWQVGLMLALQNKSFATELFKWRRQNNQKTAFLKMRETLQCQFGNMFDYSNNQINLPQDPLIHNIFIGYWHKHMWPKLMQSGKDNTNSVVKIADSSGLLKNSYDILPGLLSVSELEEIVEKSEDPISVIIQRVKEKN